MIGNSVNDLLDEQAERIAALEAENAQLREAKRMAGLIADARSRENVALRATLALAQAFMPPVRPEMPFQDNLADAHKAVAAALEQAAIGPAPEGECPDCGTPYAMGAHTDECPRS